MDFAAMVHYEVHLPEPAFDLWVEGTLADHLDIPEDRFTRLEVIGGEVVETPAPFLEHNLMIADVQRAFFHVEFVDPEFRWRTIQTTDLKLWTVRDGYTPDVIVASAEILAEAAASHMRVLTPQQAAMVVEVTSKSNAEDDREPEQGRTRLTKWSGYAHEGVPFYLLIDRDPKVEKVRLYGDPDQKDGRYATMAEWTFGETVELPDPFGVRLDTGSWKGWEKPEPAEPAEPAESKASS